MAELGVANTYANALFGAAKDAGKIDQINEEIKELMEVLDKEEDFKSFLKSPTISPKDKKQVIETVFEGKLTQELVNFLYVLIDKGRIGHLEKMAKQYVEIVNQSMGYTTGTIFSTVPLKKNKIAKFEEETSKLLQENVKLVNEIDTSLIGGVTVYVEGKLIDASLKSRLDKMLVKIKE